MQDPGNLNPLVAQTTTANLVAPFAYDTLINLDQDGTVISQLASSWDATPTSVTFTLQHGVTCSDGAPLTASDVAETFAYIKDPKNHSTMIGSRLPSADFSVTSDDAAGTVTVSVPDPYGFLLQGAGLVPIVCPKGLADDSSLAHDTDGTGPFELSEYVADDHLTYTARGDYGWGPDGASTGVAGFPATVVFRVVQNETTAANLLLSGQLSTAYIGGADRSRLEGQGFQHLDILAGPDDLFFNQRPDHPGADIAVRRALTQALDLDQLATVATQGTGTRAESLTLIAPTPCSGNTVDDTLPTHDVDAAGSALDDAGWTLGADGTRTRDGQTLSVTLIYPSGDAGFDAAMELVRQRWTQLGVDVKLMGQGASAYIQTLFQGTSWDVAWLSVGTSFPTEFRQFVTGPPSPKSSNFPAASNDDYDRLSQRALSTTGQAGCDVWAQADRALFVNLDVVPVAATTLAAYSTARYREGLGGPEPTSIRLLEG
jgi:peptide/nickel transport system substrate-binding protein